MGNHISDKLTNKIYSLTVEQILSNAKNSTSNNRIRPPKIF